MRRIKTLFLMSKETDDLEWRDSVIAAIGDRHDLAIYDKAKPLEKQFEGVEVVIDQGGLVGTHEMMDVAKNTKLWQVLGTGLDHVDVNYMKSKGFIVANCPGQFSSVALAECAMMYILMLSRRFYEASQNFKNRILYKPISKELKDQTLGIIGFGASGQELAKRAKPFGIKIMGIDIRTIEDAILNEIQPDFMGTPDDIDHVIKEADFLSLHLHLNEHTRHTIDARRLAIMKPTACIINVSRGALVDEAAMHDALLRGRLGGAGLDAFASEPPDPTLAVYQLPNVVVTPHIAGVTYGTARQRAAVVAENVDRIAQGLEPLYQVG